VEGRGTTTGASLSSVVFDDDDDGGWRMARMRASSFLPLASAASATGGGVCNSHTAPFPLIHPPVDGGDSFKNDGAAYNPHAAPSFNFVYPPLLGFFLSTVVNDDGDGVYSTRRPLLLILSPPLGGMYLI